MEIQIQGHSCMLVMTNFVAWQILELTREGDEVANWIDWEQDRFIPKQGSLYSLIYISWMEYFSLLRDPNTGMLSYGSVNKVLFSTGPEIDKIRL